MLTSCSATVAISSCRNSRRASGSRLATGSSRMSSSGRFAMARVRASWARWPPDSFPARWSGSRPSWLMRRLAPTTRPPVLPRPQPRRDPGLGRAGARAGRRGLVPSGRPCRAGRLRGRTRRAHRPGTAPDRMGLPGPSYRRRRSRHDRARAAAFLAAGGRRVVPGRGLPADRAAHRAPHRPRAGVRRHHPDR